MLRIRALAYDIDAVVGPGAMTAVAEKHTEKCRSCREKIVWLRHKTTGRMAPIEARESEGGIKSPAPGLHLNHFATCKQAKAWRGK